MSTTDLFEIEQQYLKALRAWKLKQQGSDYTKAQRLESYARLAVGLRRKGAAMCNDTHYYCDIWKPGMGPKPGPAMKKEPETPKQPKPKSDPESNMPGLFQVPASAQGRKRRPRRQGRKKT